LRARPDAILLHVSGCTKGCAHAGDSPITLVAQDGAYRIIENGAAGDAAGGPAFDIGEAAARLERPGARTA
jgi:precorrin-3B synthase